MRRGWLISQWDDEARDAVRRSDRELDNREERDEQVTTIIQRLRRRGVQAPLTRVNATQALRQPSCDDTREVKRRPRRR